MRTTRALAVSAVAVAAVGLAAPSASAWTDPSNLTVSPSVIPRGGQVTVTVTGTKCQSGSTVSSDAFGTVNLNNAGGEQASANAMVHSDAAPGAHDVTVNCQGSPLTRPAAFTVIHGGVRGGLGGATETGATSTDMAIGGALVASALIGGGVFWMRRRSESKA
ncbi:hypothetical protein AB0J38_18885 [Streptomyces sp. NPDC050095]|uniref:hypothetical protein n=1 Tax=unclassified Streptomyces TaxID=2593676 RepID=UPI00344AA1FB